MCAWVTIVTTAIPVALSHSVRIYQYHGAAGTACVFSTDEEVWSLVGFQVSTFPSYFPVVPENISSKCQCEKPEWNWGDRLLLESSHIFQHLPAKIAIYLLLNTGAIAGAQGQRLSPRRGQVVRTSDISAQPKDCECEHSLQDTGAGLNILANSMNFIKITYIFFQSLLIFIKNSTLRMSDTIQFVEK